MSNTDMLDSPVGGNRLGLVLDLITKYHNGTIPEDEIIKFTRGEPTKGSEFWFVGPASISFEVTKKGYAAEKEARGQAKILRVEGDAFEQRLFEVRRSVKAGGIELCPLRRRSTDAEVLDRAFIAHEGPGYLALSDFYATLAWSQDRGKIHLFTIVGYIAIEGKLWVLKADWEFVGLDGGGWVVQSSLFDPKKTRPKGTEIVRRKFWS